MRRLLNTFMHSSSLMEVKSNIFPFSDAVEKALTLTLCILSVCVADASMYAHYLFNAFDTANNGSIKFKVNTLKLSKVPHLKRSLDLF